MLGEEHIQNDGVCLVLATISFTAYAFTERLLAAASRTDGATIFGYHVSNPKDFGVVEFDGEGNALSIEEKPENPKSDYAVPGLYFLRQPRRRHRKKPSARRRAENWEITDVNSAYWRWGD